MYVHDMRACWRLDSKKSETKIDRKQQKQREKEREAIENSFV